MQQEKTKQISAGIVVVVLIGLLAFFAISCHNSNKRWQEAKANFENSVNKTIAMYGPSVDHIYVSGTSVSIYMDVERWDNSSKDIRNGFMKEVTGLIRVDAVQSNILEYTDVKLFFLTSDREQIAAYTIKNED